MTSRIPKNQCSPTAASVIADRRRAATDLSQLLESHGFTADCLSTIADVAATCHEVTAHPAAVLVLETVARQVAELWDGPVVPGDAREARQQIHPHLCELLDALEQEDDRRVTEASNALADALFYWRQL